MTELETPRVWPVDAWLKVEPEPLPLKKHPKGYDICPFVGVPIPRRIRDKKHFEIELHKVWYSKRERKTWDMLPFKRDEWFNYILDHWEVFNRRIREDMTPRLKKNIKKLKEKGGWTCIVGGEPSGKGDGKSIIGLMLCDLYDMPVPPTVLFEHAYMQATIDEQGEEDVWLVLNIDEDLTATGQESGHLIIEVLNTWQTNRKVKLIINSIGIDPGKKSSAIDLHLIPAGINVKRQAVRVACFMRGKYVGWAVLQRKYPWDWLIRFGNEWGLAGELAARSAQYSATATKLGVAGVPAEVEAQHIDVIMSWLEQEKRLSPYPDEWTPPAIDVIVTEAKQLGLPTKTISYPRRIASTAIYRFTKANPEARKRRTEEISFDDLIGEVGEFWEDYQSVVFSRYPDSYALADRDAWMVTLAEMGKTRGWIRDYLKLTIRENSVSERIRYGVSEWDVKPSNTQLGTIGEKFLGSRIESLGRACVYPKDVLEESARRDVPDVSDSGRTNTAAWAVNVKVSMSHDFDRVFETSPEHDIKRSWAVFLFPKTARLAVCDIVGETTRYNSAGMVLCGIEEGVKKLVELIEDEPMD